LDARGGTASRRQGDAFLKRDQANLDIFRLKDNALTEPVSLLASDIVVQKVADDRKVVLEQFATIAGNLKK
jgi:hypothetical protein